MMDLSLHLFKSTLSHLQYQSIPRILKQKEWGRNTVIYKKFNSLSMQQSLA